MKRAGVARRFLIIASTIGSLTAGCAGIPVITKSDYQHEPAHQRDVLANAAHDVKSTPWPTPRKRSMVSRIAGGTSDDNRPSRSDAIEIYVDSLQPYGARFSHLVTDARRNLDAADEFNRTALHALGGARLSSDDIGAVEGAIRALRENRSMYVSAAKALERDGEAVDAEIVAAIRKDFGEAISALGKTADAIADKISDDEARYLAKPAQPAQKYFY